MKSIVKTLLLVLAVAVTALIIYVVAVLFSFSYSGFVQWVAESLFKKPHLVKFIPAYFDNSRFLLLQKLALVVLVIHLGAVFFLIKKWETTVDRLTDLLLKIFSTTKSFFQTVFPQDKFEKWMFLSIVLVPFGIAVYNIFTIPVSYDEAVSYIDFISKGPLVISTLYHTTNNHILSNMLSYVSCLVLPDGEVAQRLPLLFIYLINCILFFALLKRIVKPYPALIGLTFFVTSTPVFLYSFMARGYLLVILFVLLALLALRQLLLKPAKRYWVLLFASSVLGMYTIPVMAYFLLAVYLFLFIFFVLNNKSELKFLVVTGVLSLIFTCILYAPIFMVSGLEAMFKVISDISTKRTFVANALRNFKGYTNFYISSILYIKILLGVVVFLGMLYASRLRLPDRSFGKFLLLIALMPLVVTIALRQGMFDRTWIYMSVVVAIFYAFCFRNLKSKIGIGLVVVLTFILQSFSSYRNLYYQGQKHQIVTARKIADEFVEREMKSMFLDHVFIRPMIEYRLLVLKYPHELYVKRSQFRSSEFDRNVKYDVIIYSSGSEPPPSSYRYILSDSVREIRVLKVVP